MNGRALLGVLADLADAAYIAGANGPDESVELDPFVQRILAMADRTWVGEAKAAYDQSVNTADMERDWKPSPDFWVARAAAAAAIEAAEQARLSNLIAWKALQTQRQSGGVQGLPTGEDEISEHIEKGLGL